MNRLNKILICKINKDARIPTVVYPGEDLGYDIYSCENVLIPSKGFAYVSTGIKISFPEGFGAIVSNRSSNGYKKNMLVYPGVIDSGYTGELKVKVYNMGNIPYKINKGDKFAQIVIQQSYTNFEINEIDEEFFNKTDIGLRKSKGFGSSGI